MLQKHCSPLVDGPCGNRQAWFNKVISQPDSPLSHTCQCILEQHAFYEAYFYGISSLLYIEREMTYNKGPRMDLWPGHHGFMIHRLSHHEMRDAQPLPPPGQGTTIFSKK